MSRRFRVIPNVPLVGEIDERERIASVPAELTTKGMYFASFVERLGEADADAILPTLRAPPRHGKYQPFLDYPFADVLVWVHALARRAHPGKSLLEAMRLLGRDTVKVFLASKVGRVVRELNAGPQETLLRMPEMWKITDPKNVVSAEAIGGDAVRFHVEGFTGWIDCGLIGTLEQVVMNHDATSIIDAEIVGAMRGTFVVRWS